MTRQELKVLVAGCGSIGRRHLGNLKKLGVKNFVLCDPNEEALEKAAFCVEDHFATASFKEAALTRPDAAIICTPSSMHMEMALELAKNGAHLLIEKPLSHAREGCEELAGTVRKNGTVAMMAMCYRFHPVFNRLKTVLENGAIGTVYHVNYFGGHYLPDWHPYADYRREYASQRVLGGGVVLTSIHGLDNIRWLFGEVAEHHSFSAKVSSLEMDVEDLATAIFRMENGVYVNWSTDFLQRANQHRMVITGEKGTLRCDFLTGIIETFLACSGAWTREKVEYDVNDMYTAEMEHFLCCVEKGLAPSIGLADGIRTLELALAVRDGGKENVRREAICVTA